MSRIYDRSNWRSLTREGECAGPPLLGGECSGPVALHHLHDDESELLLLCARHHAALHGVRNRLTGWKTCPHRPGTHRWPGAKEDCEAKLNRKYLSAA